MSDPNTNYSDYDKYASTHQTAIANGTNYNQTVYGKPVYNQTAYDQTVVIPICKKNDETRHPQAHIVTAQDMPSAAAPPPPLAVMGNPTNNKSRNNFTSSHHSKKSPQSTFWSNQPDIGTQLNRSPQFTRQIYNEFNPPPPSTRQSHAQFIHETLNYVFGQLCVTVAIVAGMYVHKESVKTYITNNPTIIWLPIIATFSTLLSLFCCVSKSSTATRQTLFWLFTISCGAMVGVSTIQYAPHVILNASVTLLVMVGCLNIWAYKMAKHGNDISFMGPALLSGLLMIITVGILNIFIKSTFLENCITVVSIIVFSLLLVYDLNRLYNGAEEEEYADPLIAAINIYLDIINLFLNLLRLFGNNKD